MRMFSPLIEQKKSSVFIWPIETTPNVPPPPLIFWLEMVTVSEDNSVCEGKMAIGLCCGTMTWMSNVLSYVQTNG